MKRKKSVFSILACFLLFSLMLCACGKSNILSKATDGESLREESTGKTSGAAKAGIGSSDDSTSKTLDVMDSYSARERSEAIAAMPEGAFTPDSIMATPPPEIPDGKIFPGDDFLPVPTKRPISPQAGLLTASEWNDNKNPEFLKNLLANGQEQNYKSFFTVWGMTPFHQLKVCVNGFDGQPLKNASVTLLDANQKELYKAVTDNTGAAYVFYNLLTSEEVPTAVLVAFQGTSASYPLSASDLSAGTFAVSASGVSSTEKKLDLIFVIDTTGSMGDEINYLQKELEDVIRRVNKNNENLSIRLSVNFYRDTEDDYVVNPHEFSTDINSQLTYLASEYASGGGDYEEAVEQALHNAVYDHEYVEGSTRLLFHVCDAPAHNTQSIRTELQNTLLTASEKGIRIIPVASSGVDKGTEFLLRTFAMLTGGTYTFLTNDSGIGGDHIEATVGETVVENLNNLMVRLIDSYLE